jgi:hypothetical protein
MGATKGEGTAYHSGVPSSPPPLVGLNLSFLYHSLCCCPFRFGRRGRDSMVVGFTSTCAMISPLKL